MFLSMKTVSVQLSPDVGGPLVNETDSFNMYNRVVLFLTRISFSVQTVLFTWLFGTLVAKV